MRSSIVGVESRGILEVRGIVECSLKKSWHSRVFAMKDFELMMLMPFILRLNSLG